MLEAAQHGSNSFVTLTYSSPPLGAGIVGVGEQVSRPTLEPKHLSDWLKRYRHAVSPVRIRYYAVGEYGDLHGRPHYHAALFGAPGCFRGNTLRSRGRPVASGCCESCKLVGDTWGLGDVDVGTLGEHSAQYLAGYTVKKMTRTDDPRLEGRHPEFARMSLRPGLGKSALWEVADVLMKFNLDESEADVPSALRHGRRVWPLGRYLRQQLRLMIGKEVSVPDEVLREAAEKMRPLCEAAKLSAERPSLKAQIVETFKQDVLNYETRAKIFKKRGSI